MADRPPRQRADAAENRRLILAAALEALGESSEVSLNSIAARAGVANATLYRHFPTRESLVLEVYRYEVQQLVAGADEFGDHRAGQGQSETLEGMIQINAPIQPGDSGGTFYSTDGTSAWIRGNTIASGGGTAYTEPWTSIAPALGLTIVTG